MHQNVTGDSLSMSEPALRLKMFCFFLATRVCLKGSIFFPLTFMGALSHNWLYRGLSLACLNCIGFVEIFLCPLLSTKSRRNHKLN